MPLKTPEKRGHFAGFGCSYFCARKDLGLAAMGQRLRAMHGASSRAAERLGLFFRLVFENHFPEIVYFAPHLRNTRSCTCNLEGHLCWPPLPVFHQAIPNFPGYSRCTAAQSAAFAILCLSKGKLSRVLKYSPTGRGEGTSRVLRCH